MSEHFRRCLYLAEDAPKKHEAFQELWQQVIDQSEDWYSKTRGDMHEFNKRKLNCKYKIAELEKLENGLSSLEPSDPARLDFRSKMYQALKNTRQEIYVFYLVARSDLNVESILERMPKLKAGEYKYQQEGYVHCLEYLELVKNKI